MTEIRLYETERGASPITEYIDSLGEKDQNKVLAYIKKLERDGHRLRRPTAAHVAGRIWELRPNDHRIFYTFTGQVAVLLHVFVKKTSSIPNRELKIAKDRLEAIQ